MDLLTSRRASRLRVLIANLAEGERESEEIGSLEAQIRTDYHGRFLIELVQNGVDPALKAGLTSAQLLIVRTPELLAVMNQGAPFDEAGRTSIMSLALSAKRPDAAIGNKGVGFKSVFEVASSAEIFSVAGEGRDLSGPPALGIRLGLAPPADQPGLIAEALEEALADPRRAAEIVRRHGSVEAALRAALGRTPGWRYPERLDSRAWAERAAQLGLSREDRARFQTAVVLQISALAGDKVTRAVDELVAHGHEMHLFLPAVRRIELREPVGITTLEREDTWTDHRLDGFAVRCLRTSIRGGELEERRYWMGTCTVAGPEVARAACELPGAGWLEVSTAVVQVALPLPRPDQALASDGRYFVGLPTKDPTGSPFRVDARFHATLSRTALDRVDNPYNVLLDCAAAELAADLLRRLRDARADDPLLVEPELGRRAVTLALAGGAVGSFGQAVRRQLAGEATVLMLDGERFTPPPDGRRVEPADRSLVNLVVEVLGKQAWQPYRVRLIEAPLEKAAHGLLQELGVPVLTPEELLARVGGKSVLERLAERLPREDVESWETLLKWLCQRLPEGAADQRLLPATGNRLLGLASRPFVPLLSGIVLGEVRADEIPSSLSEGLDFLDARIVAKADLRRALVEGARPLARLPVPVTILSGAVLPALERAVRRADDGRARALLLLGLGLLRHVGHADEVQRWSWWVPCVSGWRLASEAYLGDAWDSRRRGNREEEMGEPREPGNVERVYGPEGRCVVPWWGAPPDEATNRAALIRVGVETEPRIRAFPRVERVIWSEHREGTWVPDSLPAQIPSEVWTGWFREVRVKRATSVDWGPRTWWHLDGVTWIDGLERPEARVALAGWALAKGRVDEVRLVPEREQPNRFEFPVLLQQPWLWILRSLDEPFVPSHPDCVLKGALARPSELCQPTRELKVDWIPRAADGLSDWMLGQIGVRTLSEMPTEWLLDLLGQFAQSPGDPKRRGMIARSLWSSLNARAAERELPPLQGRALPLWRDGEVVPVSVEEVDELYLIDDAYAAEILGAHLDGRLVLEPEGERWTNLLMRLQERLPGARLRRVSEVPCPYQASTSIERAPLVQHLAHGVGVLAVQVICALIRGRRGTIKEKKLQQTWERLRGARVQLRALPNTAPAAVWLPAEGLLVCQSLDDSALVAALWPVLGPEWRADLLALGDALRRGERGVRDLMRHRHIKEETVHDAVAHCRLDELLGTTDGPARSPAPAAAQTGTLAIATTLRRTVDEGLGASEPETDDDLSGVLQAVLQAPPPPLPTPPALASGPATFRPRPQRASRSPRRGSDEYAREIGHLGEVFAFRTLSAQLPEFTEACWVSTSRAKLGLSGGDDTLGYDFQYLDLTGRLSGRPGARCYIEVKANGGPLKERFAISSNEWRLAERCSGSGTEVFLLLQVWGITDQPQLGPLHIDPVALAREGRLRLSPRDGWWATTLDDGPEPLQREVGQE